MKRQSSSTSFDSIVKKTCDSGRVENECLEQTENDHNLTEKKVITEKISESKTVLALDLAEHLLKVELEQAETLMHLDYPPPVAYTYNPIDYAFETHAKFVRRYCTTTKPLLFIGMNPGPFGMAQTGVPFGEVSIVKNWIQISGCVGKPLKEHPKRPIQGFDCPRNEVSGQRFWSFFQDLCKTPETFFRSAFVHNYCPLLFMRESSKNITPNELPITARKKLQDICDDSLVKVVQLLQVKFVVGLGRFAQARAKAAFESKGITDIPVGFLMHPSPINPAANKGWQDIARKQLTDLNVMQYLI